MRNNIIKELYSGRSRGGARVSLIWDKKNKSQKEEKPAGKAKKTATVT